MSLRGTILLLFFATLAGCSRGPAPPATLDTKIDACSWCRKMVSDVHFAAQLVAPSEKPRFFDDIGCLATFLKSGGAPARGQVAYVADHRTKQWIRAGLATYTKKPTLATPMSSGILAHADVYSRDADPDAAGGTSITVRNLFGPAGIPEGGR